MSTTLSLPGKIVNREYASYSDYETVLALVGVGNWGAFRALAISLEETMEIAKEWGTQLGHIERPWLCWNVNDEWCLIQQKLVAEIGWTPLVGFDPRVGPPKSVLPQSVVFDFNKNLHLPILYPHFPLEFAFLFCSRMAFWHSDLLVRRAKMRALAGIFETLTDGQTAATWVSPGLRYTFVENCKRYWELVGCTTRAASRDQFDKGCGWWKAFWEHPNQANAERVRGRVYWDHGAGIYYWHKRTGGDCVVIDGKQYVEGHFTKIGNKNYRRTSNEGGKNARRRMSEELVRHFDLRESCAKLGLVDMIAAPAHDRTLMCRN